MKLTVTDTLKLAGIVAAGVGAYLIVTKTVAAGGEIVKSTKEVLTKDLNPFSDDNIIQRNLSEKTKNSFGKFFDFIFRTDYYSDPSNVQKQSALLLPKPDTNKQIKPVVPSNAGAGQSSKDYTAHDPRRFDLGATYNTPAKPLTPETCSLILGVCKP